MGGDTLLCTTGTQGWRRFVYEDPRTFLGEAPSGSNHGNRRGGFHGRGNDGNGGDKQSSLPKRTQAEFDRAERLFGVHH